MGVKNYVKLFSKGQVTFKAVIRAGVLQLNDELEIMDALVEEQKAKLKEELKQLDVVFNGGRRIILFRDWDDVWNKDTMEERLAELAEHTKKSELLTKVVKNVAAGMK